MAFTLVTREGCGLCEKAERALWSLGIPYVREDVDRDPELRRLYTFRVPVLLWEGRVVLEGVFDERSLAELARLLEDGWTP
ncbi:glutaredoxin family protein [Thermus filiformis]|uniref:Thioredoxin n=1 Tax=Thermus filiformis TaxID=276 RepID=A0A0D6XCN7_THEFI|nr:glutaredoxin family protein [Thermus filiformis]KIX84643.1 thioredoxin [Thermus filiformis]